MSKEYDEFKKLCDEEGCYCPAEHILRLEIANTMPAVRLWFKNKGNEL